MARALALARRGEALASPNPMVGAVLVRDGRVVGEASTPTTASATPKSSRSKPLAGRRAAPRSTSISNRAATRAAPAPARAPSSPRASRASSPPCAIPIPPSPGKGFRQLRAAGIEVVTGVAEAEAQRLNEAFAVWITTQAPAGHAEIRHDARRPDGPAAGQSTAAAAGSPPKPRAPKSSACATPPTPSSPASAPCSPTIPCSPTAPACRAAVRCCASCSIRGCACRCDSELARTAKGDVIVFAAASASGTRARALARAGIEVVELRSSS